MAHELTIRKNGKAEMAYAGDTPWHGLGQPVTAGASIGVWQHEAGMDWEAMSSPVLWRGLQVKTDGSGRVMRDDLRGDTGSKVIWRSDTEDALAVVGSNYKIVQPKEVLEFFRDLTEDGGWHIHTAGTLRGGRKLWAMASNGIDGNVGKKGTDNVRMNLLLATSLDGSMKTQAMMTSIRVVCANTLAMALQENGEVVRISHRSVFDPAAIKRSLGVAEESFEAFMRTARELANTPINLDHARDVLREIFGTPAPQVDTSWMGELSRVRAADPIGDQDDQDIRSVDRVLQLFDGAGLGSDMATAKGTRWGLLNAVTQHVDHEMGRSRDTGLDNAWFGRGNKFKQEAFELLALT